jgi:hypothetical protein
MALTAHFDASNNANVFEDIAPGSDPAEDGEAVLAWQDEGAADLALYPITGNPDYRAATPAAVEFTSANFDFMRFRNNANSAGKTIGDLMGASAKTIIIALTVEAIILNETASYNNDLVLGDDSYFGIYLKNSTPKKIITYNWDGSETPVLLDVELATLYIYAIRHDGTDLFASLNGGTEASVASGATEATTGELLLGGGLLSRRSSIRVHEFKIWNEDRVATLAADIAYFTDKWLEQVATPTIDPDGGSHVDEVEITLATATAGATIYYTIVGSTPDATDTEYTAPFTITESATVKAIAIKAAMTDSEVASADFEITEAGVSSGGGKKLLLLFARRK